MSGNCLVTDSVFPVVVAGGRGDRMSLPGVLATLAGGDIVEFPGLAAHQRQSWFHFLVQLAAIALHRGGLTEPPGEAETWTGLLRALAPDAAWSLVGTDLSQPAFLQPPIQAGSLDGYSPLGDTPDRIDLLNTAKNHDVKRTRFGQAEPYHWVYGLLNLQTMQGVFGNGKYGIARMNGGYGSRVLVDFVPDPPTWGNRFRRAVGLLHDQRDTIVKQVRGRFRPEDGTALLWLEPWDDDDSLSLADLDPYFIEICRRVRLVRPGGTGPIMALDRTSKGTRVQAEAQKGKLGDPWTPVDQKKGVTLTVMAGGFHYRQVADILFSKDYTLPPSLKPRPDDPDDEMLCHFAVLVRGQGGTDGLYERLIPARHAKAFRGVHNAEQRLKLHLLANRIIKLESNGTKYALRAAVYALLMGGRDDKINFIKDRPNKFIKNQLNKWSDQLDHCIDGFFFDHVWAIAAAGDDLDASQDRLKAWQKALYDTTKALFAAAVDQLPTPLVRRERARARAEAVFDGLLNKALPLAKPERHHDTTETAA